MKRPRSKSLLVGLIIIWPLIVPLIATAEQGRIHLGVTVSGHILVSVGWEQFIADDLTWRADLHWAPAFTPNGGWELALQRLWPGDAGDPRSFSSKGRDWTLSTGFLQLWAREIDGTWRHLSLLACAPGHNLGA